MTTTDTTALQERIARALYENAEYYGPEPIQPPWDSRDDEERGEWMEIAAAVLPIIARVRRDAAREALDGLYEDASQEYRIGLQGDDQERMDAAEAVLRATYAWMDNYPEESA